MESFDQLCLKWWDGFYASFQSSCSMTCVTENGSLSSVNQGEISILLGVGDSETSTGLFNSCDIPNVDAFQFNQILCKIEAISLPKIILMYERYKSSLHLENESKDSLVVDLFPDDCVSGATSDQAEPHSSLEMPGNNDNATSLNASAITSSQAISEVKIVIETPEDNIIQEHPQSTYNLAEEDRQSKLIKDEIILSVIDTNVRDSEHLKSEIVHEDPVLSTPLDAMNIDNHKSDDVSGCQLMLQEIDHDKLTSLNSTCNSGNSNIYNLLNSVQSLGAQHEAKQQESQIIPVSQIRRSSRQVRVSSKFADDSDAIRKILKPEVNVLEDQDSSSQQSQCVCVICRKEFPNSLSLSKHLNTHTLHFEDKPTQSFFCRKCQSGFPTHQKLESHSCSRATSGVSVSENVDQRESGGAAGDQSNSVISSSDDPQDNVSLQPESEKLFNTNQQNSDNLSNVNKAEDCEGDSSNSNSHQHTCDLCSTSFPTGQLLKEHRTSHGRRPYMCTTCNKRFTHMVKLRQHQDKQHGNDLTHSVESQGGKGKSNSGVADKRVKDANLAVHSKDKSSVCGISGKRLKKGKRLNNRSGTPNHDTQYQCELCPKSFAEKRNLDAHMRAHLGVKPYSCDLCGKTFRRVLGLQNHKRLHDSSKAFKCDICDKFFVDKWGLVKHKSIHTGEKPFKCGECGKTFRIKKGLLDHVKLHNKDLQLKCDLCPRRFVEKRKLQEHMRAHRGEKAYICNQCGQSFINSMTLKVHKRIHTGEKPYNCSFCEMSFNQQSTLTAHERYHKGEKPYVCELCGHGFYTKSHLTIHRRKHFNDRPYKCDQCDYAAYTNNILRIHKLRHSNDKPFQCAKCSSAFKRRHHLDAHMRTHAKTDKLFNCEYCESVFSSSRKLNAHLATHEVVLVTSSAGTDDITSTHGPVEVAYDVVLLSQ